MNTSTDKPSSRGNERQRMVFATCKKFLVVSTNNNNEAKARGGTGGSAPGYKKLMSPAMVALAALNGAVSDVRELEGVTA